MLVPAYFSAGKDSEWDVMLKGVENYPGLKVTAILNPTQARTFIGIGFAVPIENAAAAVGMPPF